MSRNVGALSLSVCLFCVALFAGTVEAQIQPRIMLAVDTSGSMGLDFSGAPTFGDGVVTGCGTAGGIYCGTNCTAGMDTDCDGIPNDSRIFIAKSAIRNMIYAYGGDLDFAMSRFQQNQGVNISCPTVNTNECNPPQPFVTSYGNPQCNSGGGCAWNWNPLYPVACRPGGANPSILNRQGGDPTVCGNYSGFCDGAGSDGGDVLVGFPGFGPFTTQTNLPAMLKWIDNAETGPVLTATTPGNFCNHSTTGDCEMRPSGGTPLAGLLADAQTYMSPIRTADPVSTCRPYSVILITDGAQSSACTPNNPATAAANLLAAGIKTYVIGLATSSAQLNDIATAGGTDAGAAGGDTAFYADDETELSIGLAQVVAESVLFETCNGADDDCDSIVDEGFPLFCNRPAGNPTANLCVDPGETVCNGVDDNCNGVIDEGVLNACGECGAVPTEICDGIDNDCDGIIDEGCGGCIPSSEICDNLDNDCDSVVDEDLSRVCGTNVGDCAAGAQICTTGVWGACSGTGPTAEVCDNRDNDCDGVIDGITRTCGSDTGACQAGTQICNTGSFGSCTGAVGPSAELCDNIDNDCDGTTDDGNPGGGGGCGSAIGECSPGTLSCMAGALTCTGGTGPVAETCNADDDDCDGNVDESVPTMGACGSGVGECSPGVRRCVSGSFSCVGARGPVDEVCDGRDNNCNGAIDDGNPGGGTMCGTATGVCELGTSRCTGGALVCEGGTGGSMELCDLLDNDCDGLIDEDNPGGGGICGSSDVGICERGALACTMGTLSCVGERGPGTEICDGLDNDCDGAVDEMNPEGGAACGDDTGECMPGTTLCMAGALVCDGGVGPTPEICDGLDNDCDGVEDEGLGVGAPCGSDTGECSPGVNICRDGMLVCEGEIGPIDESCDSLDNDCDESVDEGLAVGGECGATEGLCMPGALQCVDGAEICVGEIPAVRESCDCSDNDCDGAVDEEPAEGTLCPDPSSCVQCQCALPCSETEFGFSCPTGKAPRVQDGMCFCVADACDPEMCAMETLERDGEVLCAPEVEGAPGCVCKNNECSFPCDGVVCEGGLVCAPDSGRCVEDSCRGLGCGTGEVCNRDTGECDTDPCETAGCSATQVCRDGACETSCATVMCSDGEICRSGSCVPNLCNGVSCVGRQVCDEATGDCIADMCFGVRCPDSTECDPTTGMCGEAACARVRCPGDEICIDGECAEVVIVPDGGVDAGRDSGGGIDAGTPGDENRRILATGGGGCACSTTGDEAPTGAGWIALGLLGFVFVRRRRRALANAPTAGRSWGQGRKSSAWIAGALACALSWLTGCDVEPYCIDCEDGSTGADVGVDAGGRDGGPDVGSPDVPVDSGVDADVGPDACLEIELCNMLDDDCDGIVDEGIDTTSNPEHCGGCGNACTPAHAFPICADGACGVGSCDVGWYDLNSDLADGCEYRCLSSKEDDSLCDLRDNDCDGEVDEDVPFETDPLNCGVCGRVCRFAHVDTEGCAAGDCTFTDEDCEENFYNIDGAIGNGCEYACTPAADATEICNGRDDDCDGDVDEADPGGGGACGSNVGECSRGVERCVAGAIICSGEVSPSTETCNGLDDDCDGDDDEGNPEGGRLCGTSIGACSQGRETCVAGALACVGDVGAMVETCDGLDNDCDTRIDEMDPGGGGACGDSTGECVSGVEHCRGGVVVCEGAVGATDETCNGRDDDCDGMTDELNPGGGGSCGTDVGDCVPGTRTCLAGTLQCVGATSGSTETCDSADNDCDGSIDEMNPGGGGPCGITTGACTAGAEQCLGGTLQCIGGTGPVLETCNMVDDDCDGATDEIFSLSTDIRNCGMCGRMCSFPNAIPGCSGGSCMMIACTTGFFDINGLSGDGCEYACSFNGAEVCNGLDDDCDGMADEGLTAPGGFCNPNGVCAGTTATCGGAAGWECSYDATFEETEDTCDGLDNDCDGSVDEPFPLRGNTCSIGLGVCAGTGTFVCNGAGDATECNASMTGMSAPESCNNLDDDCDGSTDEDVGVLASGAIDTTRIPRVGGGFVNVMRYEASRPDASAASAGSASTLACSTANRIPWTNVTWQEATNACCALNSSGTCAGGGAQWRLCSSADWTNACTGPADACTWAYNPISSCGTSSPTRCNGDEYDCDPGMAGTQDCLFPTGSGTFPNCRIPWSTGSINDMSGNVKEWTSTAAGSGHEIRGGSYNNIEAGRTCGFDFVVGDNNFSFPTVGFRCCYYE